ncbi:MAG: hypothetical protein MUO73_07205 [Thermoplasmata archaeon]|nr:hypothetical protein [Thermoplasmata archaeon]
MRRDISQEEPFSSQTTIQHSTKKTTTSSLQGSIQYLLKRRRQNIINSMVRPLYQEALKSLFIVFTLFLDTLIPLEIMRMLSSPLDIALAILTLGFFFYVEIRIYNSYWGKKGRWSLDKYKKSSGKAVEEKKDVV